MQKPVAINVKDGCARKKAISAGLLVLVAYATTVDPLRLAALAITHQIVAQQIISQQSMAQQSSDGSSWRSRGPAETAGEPYQQLRREALANAEVRLSPRLRNPKISSTGLDPAVASTLEQQRAYLENPGPPVPGSATSTCNGPAIRSVNGSRAGAIFTPQAPENVYRIEGCAFASARGRVQLEPRPQAGGQPAAPIVLQVESSPAAWSDREIKARLDPHLTGIPDSPVTLVVYTASGQRLEMPGCLFVAARGERQLLRVIPASWVTLDATRAGARSIEQLEYVSPPVKGGEVPKDAAGTSALVVRSDPELFGPGSDTYDFSNLGPGWVVDSVQLQTYAISCPADITYPRSFGRWDVTWDRKGFTISWQGDVCKSYAQPFFNPNLSLSQYAAKVWVIGPAGTRPVPGGLQK